MAPRVLPVLLVAAAAAVARGEVLHERVTVVAAPPASAAPADGEPIYGASSEPAPDERAGLAMDRDTGPEPPGTRVYHEPFNPAVFPFKRALALDAVGADERLVLAARSAARRRLPVLGAARRDPGRDAFWGSIVVDFAPGAWVPLPSPAAEARILEARVEPPAEVVFARDGADNQYVMSTAGGRHRLVWLTDAPARYFAGEVPAAARIGDEPPLPAPVPAVVRRRAERVLARIGVDARPRASLRAALDALVAWFRAFTPGAPPPTTESTYVDLALAQHGSCRHRSYAFVVTALAAGIPARYVENELHVFVEVYVPRVGWRRINLGGALVDEAVAGAEGKVPYRPRGGDPFPQPPAFAGGGDATPPAPKELAEAEAGRAGAGDVSESGGASDDARQDAAATRVNLDRLEDDDAGSRAGGRGAAASARVATGVSLAVGARESFRGDRVDVSGVVHSADGKPGGLRVEVYLDGPGGALRVGDAVAAPDGAWRAQIVVPRELSVGEYRVVARTPGDARRRASRSR